MFLVTAIIEVFTILTGLFCLHKNGPVHLHLLLLLTLLAFLNDNIVVVAAVKYWHIPGNIFYNIYSLVEISCWFFIYRKIFASDTGVKTAISILWIIVMLYSLTELMVIHSFREFHSNSYVLHSTWCILVSLGYLWKVNKADYYRVSDDPAFWICAASICFNSIFLVNLIPIVDSGYWLQPGARNIFHLLQSGAVITYYILICVAFISFYYKYRKQTVPAS